MRLMRSGSGIDKTAVKWVLDADIRAYFDTVNHEWLVRFVEHRIGDDERVLRLIRKWLKAGVMDGGVLTATEIGTPQGAVISPLLANIYLHFVFDLWAQQMAETSCGFEHEAEAKAFLADLKAAHGNIRAFAASPEDTADRIWPRCSRKPQTPWTGKAGDLYVSRIRSYLRQNPSREVLARTQDAPRSDAGEAQGDQSATTSEDARAHTGTGTLARSDRAGVFCLPRDPNEQ